MRTISNIDTQNISYKWNKGVMEKNSSPEPIPLKSSIQGSSDLQPPDEAITFISISHYEMHKLVHDACMYALIQNIFYKK